MRDNKLALQQNQAPLTGRTTSHFTLLFLSLLTLGSLSGCVGGGGGGGAAAGGGGDTASNSGGGGTTSTSTTPTTTTPTTTTPTTTTSTQSPAGIWRGSVTTQAGTFPSIGLVSDAGDMRLITTGSNHVAGTFTFEGTSFTANLRSYVARSQYIFRPAIHGSASGSIHPRSALSGIITLHDATTSTFSFTYDPLYEKDSSLALIAGNYSKTNGGYTVTFSIDAAGVWTGSDNTGCKFNGNVALINSNFNMYKIDVITTDCGEANGHNFGVGALLDTVVPNDTLLFSLESWGREDLLSGIITRT